MSSPLWHFRVWQPKLVWASGGISSCTVQNWWSACSSHNIHHFTFTTAGRKLLFTSACPPAGTLRRALKPHFLLEEPADACPLVLCLVLSLLFLLLLDLLWLAYLIVYFHQWTITSLGSLVSFTSLAERRDRINFCQMNKQWMREYSWHAPPQPSYTVTQ